MSFGYSAIGAIIQSASAATLTPVLPPAAVSAGRIGGVYVAVINIKSNSVISTATSGWTKVSQTTGSSLTQAIFTAPLGSGNPVLTWTGAVAAGAYVFYIEGTKGTLQATAIGASASATGGSSPHTNAGTTSTRTWSIGLMIDSVATFLGSYTTAASGWTKLYDVAFGTTNMAKTLSYRNFGLGTSSTGSISTPGTATAATWITDVIELQYTSAIADDGNATSVGVAENEIDLWLSPGNGVAITELESNTWLGGGAGVAITELESNTWLGGGAGVAVAEFESVIWSISPDVSVAEMEIVIWIEWPDAVSTTPPLTARRRHLIIN